MNLRFRLVGVLFVALSACGSDAPPDAPLAPGTLGEAAARIRVRVIDARTREPLVGARVEADEEVVVDAAGEAIVAVSDVVTARAEGHRTETFVGAEAGALTIALAPLAPTPTRQVSLVIPAWSAFVAEEGDTLVARVQVSRDLRIDTEATAVAECTSADTTCEVTLDVAHGDHVAFAELLLVDLGDVSDPEDDVEEAIGLAVGELAADATAVRLARLDAVVEVALELRRPMGIDAIVGVPGVRVGPQVMLYSAPGAGRTRFVVPALEGAFEGATLWAVESTRAGDVTSRVVVRAQPGELRGAFSFTEAPLVVSAARVGDVVELAYDAPLATITSADRTLRIFDSRTSIPAAWVTGELVFEATEATSTGSGWDLDDVERQWSRRATVVVP